VNDVLIVEAERVDVADDRHDVDVDLVLLSRVKPMPDVKSRDPTSINKPPAKPKVLWKSSLPLKEVRFDKSQDLPDHFKIEISKNASDSSSGSINPPYHLLVTKQLGLEQAIFETLRLGTQAQVLKDDWTESLRIALSQARTSAAESRTGVTRICSVWEVHRSLFGGGWGRPAMFGADNEQANIWMDEDLQRRHPLLDPSKDWTKAPLHQPPSEALIMLPMWKSEGDWKVIVKDGVTDKDGWQYGTYWGSIAWSKAPRPVFDVVRRRQWQKEYHID